MTIEAMKQALEALEYIDNNYMSLPKIGNKSITALRAAIEVAEKQEPVLWQWKDSEMVSPFDKTNVEGWTPLYTTQSAAQPAPVQEPVGEAYLCDKCQTPFDGAWECPNCGHRSATKEPVYTAPPAAQRQWVGLTEDEQDELVYGVYDSCTRMELAIGIEAKLREKNAA